MATYRMFYMLRWSIVGAVLGAVLLLVQGWLIYGYVTQPASVIIKAEDYNTIVTQGDFVVVDFTALRPRECISQTTRWLWRDMANDKREVIELSYSAMAFGHSEPQTPRDYRFKFPIPSGTPLGEWNVRTLHADYCSWFSWVFGPNLRTSNPQGITVVPK